MLQNEFADYLRKLGKSENTIKTYCYNMEQFFQWCRDSFDDEPQQLYRANVLDYISYMRNVRGYHAKTVNNHLSSLRSLNEYLIGAGCQTEIVVLDSDFMKIQIQYASPCTVEQKDVEAFRQRLLEGGNKRDYAIREYLKVRDSDSPYLFVSRQSGKMNPSRINQIFNQYSDIITPKTLRHYFCSHALETGYAIHEIANQAGHSNVQTTLIYSNPTAKEMKDKANQL